MTSQSWTVRPSARWLPQPNKVTTWPWNGRLTKHKRKLNKHARDVENSGGRFVPFVVSLTGVTSSDFLTEILKISSLLAGRWGVPDGSCWSDMIAELSCTLERGNYCIINEARQVMAEGAEEASRQAGDAGEGGAMRARASRNGCDYWRLWE